MQRGRELLERLFSYKHNAPRLVDALNQAFARGSYAQQFAKGDLVDMERALVYYNSNRANEVLLRFYFLREQDQQGVW